MEDSHITDTTSLGKGIYLFSVFDGHGGNEVAYYLRDNFWKVLKKHPNFKSKDNELALVQTFKMLDEQLITSEGNQKLKELSHSPKTSWDDSKIRGVAYSVGSTACVALITSESIFVANLGDSRCIISKGGKAYDMSVDHKPNLSSEKKRIKAAGGFIKDNRVQGMLNLSRSFGDMIYKDNSELSPKKQLVISVPEICEQKLDEDVDFLFLACDGIWECMNTWDVVDFIHSKLKKSSMSKKRPSKMSHIVEDLFNKNLAKDVVTSGKS